MQDDEESVVGASPPPRKTDVLFGSGTDSESNACISGIDNVMAYQDGYRRAALHLAQYVCKERQGQDFLVYPIVYLYRHHIELTLKSIVRTACFLTDRTLTKKEHYPLDHHDLAMLWNLAKPLLNPVCELGGSPALPAEDLEGIDSYITQLHNHDPDGQRFRYALAKSKYVKGKQISSLPDGLKHINIKEFAIALEKLADYLDGIDMWFGDLIDAKLEFQTQVLHGTV
ncbi:MAG: hypothetical protein ACRYFU_25960 [Janthinobacterium lividum]